MRSGRTERLETPAETNIQGAAKIENKKSKYLLDITALAETGQILPVSGIEKELEKVVNVLSAPTKNNPVLIDEVAGSSLFVAQNLAVTLNENAPGKIEKSSRLTIKTGRFDERQ